MLIEGLGGIARIVRALAVREGIPKCISIARTRRRFGKFRDVFFGSSHIILSSHIQRVRVRVRVTVRLRVRIRVTVSGRVWVRDRVRFRMRVRVKGKGSSQTEMKG